MVHHNKYTKKRSHSNKDGTRRNKYVYKGGDDTTQSTEESSQPSLIGTIGNSFNSTMGKLSEAVSGTPSKENTVTPDKQNTVATQPQTSPMETSPPVTPPNEKVDDDNEMEEMKSYTMELVNALKEKEDIENKLTTLLATMPAVFNEPIQEETSLVNDETTSSSDEEDNTSVQSDDEDNMSVKSEQGSQEDGEQESQEDNMSVENDEEGSPESFNPKEQEKQEQ